jgi:hypothetical protein
VRVAWKARRPISLLVATLERKNLRPDLLPTVRRDVKKKKKNGRRIRYRRTCLIKLSTVRRALDTGTE